MPPSPSARRFRSARLSFLYLLLGSCVAVAGGKHRKTTPTPEPSGSPEAIGLKNIPLTVGHDAKGLILPNYDTEGHLLGRFEAAIASRIDQNHVRFNDLKMQTFDEHQQPDFNIVMSEGILNLETRILDSQKRSKLKRTDFEIAGDRMSFNTETHQGTMRGNVHMTIFNQKEIAGASEKNAPEKK
jgi:hypothetical protein